MTTHPEDGGDNTLGGSGFEVLDPPTGYSDDDGTSSVCSIADNDSEASMEDSESLAEYQDDPPNLDPNPGIPAFGGLDKQHLDQSGTTFKSESFGSDQVVFEEPEDFVGEQISVSSRVVEFNEAYSMDISQHLGVDGPSPTKLFATVRQTMSKHQLVMEETFRILYVGATSAKGEITRKLGGALAVPVTESTSSSCSWESAKGSRFNVIPVSHFGAYSSPSEVELVESFGVEVVVDECTAARAAKRENRPDTLSLWLNGTQSVLSSYGDNGPQLESPGWKLPHLAVVFCSEDDNTQRRMTRVYARSFMARHSVPTLVISQDPLYHRLTENYTLDTRSVHMCLESQSESKYGHLVHKRFPIDLNTFLNLDVRQMNRNLACITGISPSPDRESAPIPVGGLRTSVSSISSTNRLLRDVEKAPQRPALSASGSLYWVREQKREDLWKVFLVGWIFVCGLAGATFAIACMKFKSPMPDEALGPIVKSITASTSSVMPPTTVSIITSLSTAVHHSSSMTTSSCGPKMDMSGLDFDPNSLTLNQSDQFTVHVIGDNHVIIRPPQKYLLLRKPPALFIEVTRCGEKISSELSKPLEGVYTLEVDSEEAWGLVKISISTKSTPLISETLEVDFGSPWLKLSGWLKAMEQKRTEIQDVIEQAMVDADQIANELSKIAGKQAVEAKEAMVARAKEITQGVSKLYQGTKSITLKQYIPSVSKSEYVRKAQRQAKIVWEKEAEKLVAKKEEVKRGGWLGR